jgi:hypothetical protein
MFMKPPNENRRLVLDPPRLKLADSKSIRRSAHPPGHAAVEVRVPRELGLDVEVDVLVGQNAVVIVDPRVVEPRPH